MTDLDDARELHREVVRHLVEQIAELTRERDRALACEAAARGLLADLSSPPSPTSAPGECPRCDGTGIEPEHPNPPTNKCCACGGTGREGTNG